MTIFTHILTRHYAEEEINGYLPDLLEVFLHNIKQEASEKETILSLRAVALLVITMMDAGVYDEAKNLLKRKISGTYSLGIKTAAIRTLGACAFFGGATAEECEEEMELFMEIITSDGQSIDQFDEPAPVLAAIQEWGLLLTRLGTYEHGSEDAVEAFAEQLDSTDVEIQIAAGQNIALLYEISYTPQGEDEEIDEIGYELEQERQKRRLRHNYKDKQGRWLVQRYKVYHNTPAIRKKTLELHNTSTKRPLRQHERRSLKLHFEAIHETIKNPRYGPTYRAHPVINQDRSVNYGTRTTIRFHRFHQGRSSWWKWMRLMALQRMLAGGFWEHYYADSRAIFDTLPDLYMSDPSDGKPVKHGKKWRAKRSDENLRIPEMKKEMDIVRETQEAEYGTF